MSDATTQKADFLAGQKAERDRVSMILGHPMAQKNAQFAKYLIESADFDYAMTKRILDTAHLDWSKNNLKAKDNGFAAAMSQVPNPQVSGVPSFDENQDDQDFNERQESPFL